MKKISDIRNVISKTIMMVVGSVLMISLFWGYIIEGFIGKDTRIKEWTQTDTILLVVAFVLMVGAAYFNRILDIIINFLSKFNSNSKPNI
jgi:hypothetical protein